MIRSVTTSPFEFDGRVTRAVDLKFTARKIRRKVKEIQKLKSKLTTGPTTTTSEKKRQQKKQHDKEDN